MDQQQTTYSLKFWPTPQDYNEAVQNPRSNLSDTVLRDGSPVADALGLPRPITGGFASVYRFECASADFAVRCFLHNLPDQAARYKQISQFVLNDTLPYTVDFDYQDDGIRINGIWFPILKMPWVRGETLEHYVASNVNNSEALTTLAERFKLMCEELKEAGIAHGDLQHGNIIVSDGELRLVDYDGMYVPSMHGLKSNELGHRNYQHPQRTADHFGPFLDNFSAWVIYASLRALAIDASLWQTLSGGEDCLLFRQSDFTSPLTSNAFRALETHRDDEVRLLGRFLRWQLSNTCEHVAAICDPKDQVIPELPPLKKPEPSVPKATDARSANEAKRSPENQPATRNTAQTLPQSATPANLPPVDSRRIVYNGRSLYAEPWIAQLLIMLPALFALGWLFHANPLLIMVALLVFVALEYAIWHEPLRCLALVESGEGVMGEIEFAEYNTQTKDYWVIYAFVARKYGGNNERYQRRVHVPKVYCETHKKGDKVLVMFNTANPNNSCLHDVSVYQIADLGTP